MAFNENAYPNPCDDCGADIAEPCIEGCPTQDPSASAPFPGESWTNDVEADADTLASAGWGTDEDYGYYGGDDY